MLIPFTRGESVAYHYFSPDYIPLGVLSRLNIIIVCVSKSTSSLSSLPHSRVLRKHLLRMFSRYECSVRVAVLISSNVDALVGLSENVGKNFEK